MSARKFLVGFFRSLGRMKKLEGRRQNILNTELSRCLSTFDITLIGISATLGSGIYVLTGDVSSRTGGAIVISITLAAIASVVCGLCYTEFAARVPKAGSAYVYSYVVIGEFFAFVVGWNLVLEYGIGAASVIKSLTTYIDALTNNEIQNYTKEHIGELHIFGMDVYIDIFSFLVSIFFTLIVALNVKNTSYMNSFCTVINVIIIVMLVAMGSFYAHEKNIQKFAPNGIHSIISGASSCYFAFIGFDAVCMVAEEASNPSKSVPISVVISISTCYVGFLAASLVLNMMIPYTEMHGSAALATAFEKVGLPVAKYIISAGAIFGLTGSAIAGMMMMPRFLYSMSQDGLIFRFFSKVNERTNIPLYSTIFGGLLTGIMTLVFELHALVQMVSVGTILAYTIVTLSVLLLRYKTEKLGMTRAQSSRLSGRSTPGTRKNSYVRRNSFKHNIVSRSSSPASESTSANVDHSGLKQVNDLRTDDSSDHETDPLLASQQEEEDIFVDPKEEIRTLVISSPFRRGNQEVVYPTPTTQLVATICSVLIMFEIFGISAVLHFLSHRLFHAHVGVIILFVLLILSLFITTYLISCMPQNHQRLFFKVPFLPWVPVFGLFLNVYILFGLNVLTWYRFGVWMAIGFLVYFGYGYRHSVQRESEELVVEKEVFEDFPSDPAPLSYGSNMSN